MSLWFGLTTANKAQASDDGFGVAPKLLTCSPRSDAA